MDQLVLLGIKINNISLLKDNQLHFSPESFEKDLERDNHLKLLLFVISAFLVTFDRLQIYIKNKCFLKM